MVSPELVGRKRPQGAAFLTAETVVGFCMNRAFMNSVFLSVCGK